MRGSGYRQPNDWRTTVKRILDRDGHSCYLCGGDAVSVDHIAAVARGGSHDDGNLAAICAPCKEAKDEQDRRAGYARRKPRVSAKRAPERHPNTSPDA